MTATVRATGLRGYGSLVRELGGDPGALAAACGLAADVFEDDDQVVPLRQAVYLLEHSAAQLGCPDFGLQLAGAQGFDALGPLALAMQHAGTVLDAFDCAARYLYVHSPGLFLDLDAAHPQARLQLGIALRNLQPGDRVQAEDLVIGVCFGILRSLSAESFRLTRAELPARAGRLAAMYRRYFVADVWFGQPALALCLPREVLDVPIRNRNESLSRIARSYLAGQFPSPDSRYSGQVELAVRRTLGTDNCTRTAIADALAVHPRTLQRRLAREGRTFEQLRETVRRERAEYYLRHTRMPLSQVSAMLGYADQAVLTRSCRRWFGVTPLTLRHSA